MKAQVAELEGNKVRISVEVGPDEVEQAIDETWARFARELQIPGFRRGKVPRRVLETRIGRPAARQDAIERHIPYWYERAVNSESVDVITEPEIEVTGGEQDGALTFDAVVDIRPRLSLEGYQSLKVTVPSPEVKPDEVQAQVDRLRGNFAELAIVEREARSGDSVVIDMNATRDGEPVAGMSYSDYSVELGSGNDLPELDDQLPGHKAGDTIVFQAELSGPVQVEVTVKEVQEKVLPDETDEWARDASEFSTVAELRADIEKRMTEIKRVQAAMSLRNNTLEALVALVEEEPPGALVDTETRRLAEELGGRLDAQGVPLQRYLEAIGATVEQVIAELRTQAVPNVKADLALRAVAEGVGIEPSEAELDEFMGRLAEQAGVDAGDFRAQIERTGRRLAVRSDLKKSKAFDWLVEHAQVVDEEGNPVDPAALRRDSETGTGDPGANPGAEAAAEASAGSEGTGAGEPVTADPAMGSEAKGAE